MAWDFSTDPEFQAKLDWMDTFVRERVEPLDVAFPDPAAPYDRRNPMLRALTHPLQDEVKCQGLWACPLGPELGGPGYGQVNLALMHEILGRSQWGPTIFGCQAPDSGNAEILAAYGTEEQKRRYLEPLLAGDIVSCFAMTEPQGGSDPRGFRCRAFRDGDGWVIEGEKYFASHADLANFLIVMAITNPDVPVHRGASMFLVPRDTPGLHIVQRAGLGTEPLGEGHHCHLRFDRCRVPAENLLGGEGEGFAIAQTRLGGGRVHHAMRVVGMAKKALQMMCERALSREVAGEPLANKQLVQQAIATSFLQLEQFRLLVLYTAWHIDRGHRDQARLYIAAVKIQMAEVLHDIVQRAVHLHGALGCSNELPLMRWWLAVPVMGITDGPTEVHTVTVARQVLTRYRPYTGHWPPEFLPEKLRQARQQLGLDKNGDAGSASRGNSKPRRVAAPGASGWPRASRWVLPPVAAAPSRGCGCCCSSATCYTAVPAMFIGIDLGGTKIEGAVLDAGYEVRFRERVPTRREEGYAQILARVQDIFARCCAVAGRTPPVVGIGTPGAVSVLTGRMKNCNTTCLNGKPLSADLAAALGTRVVLENDANLFAWAESRLGAARGYELVFGVILGTGVGGGIVWRGQIWSGAQRLAGEWGHHRVASDGPLCYCGQRGCVETFLAGPAVECAAERVRGVRASLAEVVRAARKGEAEARLVVEEFLDRFGRALANVIDILDPDCVVLGGGVSNIDELYTEGRAAVARYVFGGEFRTPLLRHQLGDSAGVIGAALLAAEREVRT